MDPRWYRLGEILVNHSTQVQPGERVMIAMGEPETFPLVQGVYQAAVKAGAFVQVQFISEQLRHSLLKYGNEDQINWVPELRAYSMDWADVYIDLRGGHNIYEHAEIPTQVLTANQRALGKVAALRWEKTRWCVVRVPDAAYAQQAETDLETVMEMFFEACFLDWELEAAKWAARAQKLSAGKIIRIVGNNTDLSFSVEGRKWIFGDGRINVPDGFIYTTPVNNSLDGKIYFEFPGIFGGRLIEDIFLEWDHGKLIRAESSNNQEYLQSIVDTDPGASLLGEFAFGTNPAINRFCKDILLDEKIYGSIHIALGRAHPQCGGVNKSAIHWDIIKDTRKNSVVYLDGKPVLKDGEFLF